MYRNVLQMLTEHTCFLISHVYPDFVGFCKISYQLDQSEHFPMFLYCLGLPTNAPSKQWIWDASVYYGVRRKRVFFRSHMDTVTPITSPPPGDDEWGPLIYLDYAALL